MKTFRVEFVVTAPLTSVQLAVKGKALTSAIFRVIRTLVPTDGFAVTEPKITELPVS
jgi:hypothetical protein